MLWKKCVVHGTFALCADVVRARLRRVVRRVVRSLVRGPCAQLCACVERLCAKPCAQELCANHPRRGHSAQLSTVVRLALRKYREIGAQPFLERRNSF